MIVTGQEGRNMGIGNTLVAGNWKMNGLRDDGAALARELAERAIAAGGGLGCELLVCPPATLLSTIRAIIARSRLALGGQYCHATPNGPHTGDIIAQKLD